MVNINLKGKRAFIAGIADDGGFGWAIAKALAAAGAEVIVGTWPPALGILKIGLEGKFKESRKLPNGKEMKFKKIYPLDAVYDTMDDVPADVRENKRYKDLNCDYSIQGVAKRLKEDFGTIDIFVHSLANGSEVKNELHKTSRAGYLGAISASAYSLISMAREFAPLMPENSAILSLTYTASVQVIPGYGGGMSSAKAALESDTRTLAWELGRGKKIRINAISAGAYASRAAKGIGFIDKMINYSQANAPLTRDFQAEDVGNAALFLLSPLASAITGTVLYVDNGIHIMGVAQNSPSLQAVDTN